MPTCRLPFSPLPGSRLGAARVLPALLLLGLAGCATGGVAMLATISGGEKIRVPMQRGGPEMTSEGGVQVKVATFSLNAEKKIAYVFGFADSHHRPLRRVKIEDVSDAAPAVLIDDAQPQLSTAGEWHGEAQPLDLGDPRLAWMQTISNSLRVFRFTLTFADGQKLVLHQGAFYPAPTKEAVREAAGQKA